MLLLHQQSSNLIELKTVLIIYYKLGIFVYVKEGNVNEKIKLFNE